MSSPWMRLNAATDALGLPGVVGLALLVFAAVLQVSAVEARRIERDRLQSEAAQLKLQHKRKVDGLSAGSSAPAGQVQAFYAHLPASTALADWLQRFYDVAARRDVSLEAVEYALAQEPGWKVSRYQIDLPVRGSYTQLRAFLADVLADMPAMALEQVEWKREAISAGVVDARIRLVLFLNRK